MTDEINNTVSKSASKIKCLTVIVVSLIFMVSLYGCSVVDSLFNKTSRLESLVESGKYEEALSYYKENRGDISKADATTYFELALDKMYQEYLSGQCEAETIMSYVTDLEKVDSDSLNTYGKSILADVDKIEASRDSFEKAEAAFEDEDYAKAISMYEQVIKDDPHYEEAQNKLTECREAYKEIKIDEAEVYASKNDYINAISSLNDALAVVGNDNELKELIESYQTSFDDLTYVNAASLANEGNYDDAIELLSDNRNYLSDTDKCDETIAGYMDIAAQEMLSSYNFTDLITNNQYQEAFEAIETVQSKYSESALIAETYEETSNEFVEYELAIIDSFIETSDYESALAECVNALNILPNASDLVDKKDYVEERQPIPLTDKFTSATTTDYDVITTLISNSSSGTITDLFGNTYSSDGDGLFFESQYSYDGYYASADFYLDGEFSKLTLAAIMAEEPLKSGEKCTIDIYGDGELIDTITVNNQSTPYDLIELDVGGVEWLQIDATFTYQFTTAAIVNTTLYYE